MITALLLFSSLLQIAVAVIALRAPKSPRTRAAWWTFGAALVLMASRRVVGLVGNVTHPTPRPTDVIEEAIAVAISVLLLVGVLRIRKLWEDADLALIEATARETSRREGENLWQRVFEYAPDGYILLEPDGKLDRLNIAAAEIAGVARDSSEGRYVFELGILDDEGLAQAARNLSMMQEGIDPGPAEYTFHRADGTERDVEVAAYAIEVNSRPLLLTVVHDVTKRRAIERELRRSRKRLEEAQRVAGVVTFEADLRSGSMWISSDPLAGAGPTEGMQMTLEEGFSFIVPEDRERVIREMASMTSGGSDNIVSEYRQIDPRVGGETVVRSTAHAETNENGDVVRLIGATLDLTGIRAAEQEIRTLNAALEERVRARTSELERAVDELEAFSYSVSHDLRSPLRAMAGYSDMVLEEDGPRLSQSSKDHLHRIRASSVRMAGLIDGLLSLSRLTRATRSDGPVNLSELARAMLAELRHGDPDRNVEVVVRDGLVTIADAGMMALVLQNLIANAWKFTRAKVDARIEFGCSDSGAFFVKDNGVGFDGSQSAKLFRPFERLHRTDEFEGTGIGLATVARIVRHYGGKAWADGSINKGSTFWFTLGPSNAAGPRKRAMPES